MKNSGIFCIIAVCSIFSAMMCSSASVAGIAYILMFAVVASLIRLYETPIKKIYIFYFIYVSIIMSVKFSLVLGVFTHLGVRFSAFIIVMMISALLASRRGFGALNKISAVFLVVISVVLVFSAVVMLMSVSAENLDFLSISTDMPLQFLMVPLIFFEKDKSIKKYSVFIFSSLLSAMVSKIGFGVIGDYAQYTEFPMYSAFQSLKIRIDIIFVFIMVTGYFILLSAVFCGIRNISRKNIDLVSAVISMFAIYISLKFDLARLIITDSTIIFYVMTTLVVMIPIRKYIFNLVKIGFLRVKKKLIAVTAVVLCFVLMSGCESVQLQNRLIIKGVGIDSGEEIRLTVQYLDNYADGDKQSNKAVTVSGKTFSEAVGKLKDSTGYEPFFGQNTAVVIGIDTANENLPKIMENLVGYSESRPTARFYISETTAEDILTFEKNGDIVPIDHLINIVPGEKNGTAFTVMSIMNGFSSVTETPTAAVVEITDDEIRLKTVAYIDETAKNLNQDEYLTYCLLNRLDSENIITVNDISCEVNKTEISVLGNIENSRLKIKIKCSPQVSVLENYENFSDSYIETMFSEYLQKIISESVSDILKSGNDIFGFGNHISFSEKPNNRNFYKKIVKSADIEISVKCNVVHTKALR